MKNYKYIETTKTLNSRIKFNNKFGNFNLLKFIDKKFKIHAGQKILTLIEYNFYFEKPLLELQKYFVY